MRRRPMRGLLLQILSSTLQSIFFGSLETNSKLFQAVERYLNRTQSFHLTSAILSHLSLLKGKFVRLAPNHISIADHKALNAVYGHSTGTQKSLYYDAFVSRKDTSCECYFDWSTDPRTLLFDEPFCSLLRSHQNHSQEVFSTLETDKNTPERERSSLTLLLQRGKGSTLLLRLHLHLRL